MLEIKLRIWDTRTKTMCNNPFHGFVGGINDMFTIKRDWIFMLYINYKDKNKTEIYEGDILKDYWGRILLVEWWKDRFTFKAITETNFIRANNIREWFECNHTLPEIVGNKFENPDLIGK